MTRRDVIAIAMVTIGILTAGVGLLAQQTGGRGADRDRAAAAQGAATTDPTIRALIEARVATAREVFEREMSRLENVVPISYEDAATWSRRWMDEELRLNPDPAKTLGALWDHLERVKRVEENASGYARAGQGRVADVLKAKYFRPHWCLGP